MTQILLSLYSFLQKRTVLRVLIMLILFSLFGYTASKIELIEDISGFMPKDKTSEKIQFVYQNMQVADRIIVEISSPTTDKDQLIEAAEAFVSQLDSADSDKKYIKEIFHTIDQQALFEITDFITVNVPYFITNQEYEKLDSVLNATHISQQLEQNKQVLVSPSGMVLKKNIITDPLRISVPLLARLQDFQMSNQYEVYNEYIFSKEKQSLLLFVTSTHATSETDANATLAKLIEQTASSIQTRYNTTITYFGSALVAVTNAQQIKKDTYISITIAVVLILLLLLWFFRSVYSIVLLAVPVLFGALLSLAALYLIKGSISAIAIGAGAVIFGIAINYSLHFLIHAKHASSIPKVIQDLASPMLTGSITTVGAFLSLLFIQADSMRDFGLFAAFSLLGTLVFVLVFMPHLLTHIKRKRTKEKHTILDTVTEYRFEKNKKILWLVGLCTIILFVFSSRVEFNADMSKLNFMTTEQKQAFASLQQVSELGKKSMYVVSEGTNVQEALREYERVKPLIDSLQQSGAILQVSGIGSFIPSDSLQKIKLDAWNNFWHTRKDSVKLMIVQQGLKVGFKETSFNQFFDMVDAEYQPQSIDYFDLIRTHLAKDYIIERDNRAMILTLIHTKPEMAQSIQNQLTMQQTFVFDSTGVSQSLLQLLSNDFNTVLFLCGFIVLLFLTISFGRLEISIICFLPMLISWIWILGLMALFGVQFNIVNIILATFIFGLGDDYTVFMMDGMMNEFAYKRTLLASYKRAVALSAITMFIGIGTLVFAKHPAMTSLANVTIVGMISVVLISYVIPPFLYNYITVKKGKKRLIPITFKHIGATVYSFAVFVIGSLALSIHGFLLFAFRKSTEQRKYRYHQVLCNTARFVVKYIPLVRTSVLNTQNETFDKPGIIICNHQSHLDLMYIMMLTPKLVVVTNEWVWNSPFYGKIVKYGDYYPVANGIENNLEAMQSLISRGYSIVIFPEGTRSADSSILRFKRGAFYVAEKLGVDIIPIVVHGIGHALPKTELLLRKGHVTVQILPRITPENKEFGETYTERARLVRQMYAQQYEQLRTQCETPEYYSDLVFHNYIYKGADVQKQARKELQAFSNYSEILKHVPHQGTVLHVGCGIGVFDLMYALVHKHIDITATDSHEDTLKLAKYCTSVPKNLQYVRQDSIDKKFIQQFDCVIITGDILDNIAVLCKKMNKSLFILQQKNMANNINSANFDGFRVCIDNNTYSLQQLQI
ncbi:MAG: 1-acyl-sn-glycerol-3-phosphate acyltransferase [Bacteroidetes bacterium ADurb.Bin217]|nr:MAG: 1-acyl-sn-glycerol-3-phosphate acyltransferase [Bacteroidetes bacterium ADurb.Bin217]